MKCAGVHSAGSARADDEVDVDGTVEEDLGKSREGSRTDDEVVQRSVLLWNCSDGAQGYSSSSCFFPRVRVVTTGIYDRKR